jgi:hypothetical protein
MPSRSPEKQPAIDDNIQRTVERTALRKVRNVLDAVGAEEAADRRVRRLAYLVSGVLLLLLIIFVLSLVH